MSVPITAIWLQVILASVVVYFSNIRSLLDYLGFTLSVSAALTVACLFWSRRSADSSSNRLLYRVIALIYVVSTIGLAVLSVIGRPQQLIGFAITIVSGLIIYFLLTRSKQNG